jgi:hypothetical protein
MPGYGYGIAEVLTSNPASGGGAPPFEYTAIANNYSMTFDGTNYIDTGAIDLGETNTISFWFKNNSANTGNGVIGDAGLFGLSDHVVYFQTVDLFYYPTGSITGRKTFGGTNIANAMADTTNWHNLILVRKAASNGLSDYNDLACYLDGNPEGTFADVYTANINLIPVYIGKSGLVGSNSYDGLIDEVAYWNTVLSEDTIEKIYNTTNDNPGKVADLSETPEGAPLAWYRFE